MPISQMHGKVFEAKASYGDIKIVPLYHPAVAGIVTGKQIGRAHV